MNEQVYYIEQWRDPNVINHYEFTKCSPIYLIEDSLLFTQECGLVTVAYFRIKLKDKNAKGG